MDILQWCFWKALLQMQINPIVWWKALYEIQILINSFIGFTHFTEAQNNMKISNKNIPFALGAILKIFTFGCKSCKTTYFVETT